MQPSTIWSAPSASSGVSRRAISARNSAPSKSSRSTRVARCGSDDGGALAAFGKPVVHQAGKQLHRHVLEGQCRAVEQFQHECIWRDLHQWAGGLMPEGRIGFAQKALEYRLSDFTTKERRQDADCEVGIGEPAHGANVRGRELRPVCRNVKTAVAG